MDQTTNIIKMYAALEKYPVKISYPDNQPRPDPAPDKLDAYKQHHSFTTIYEFG